MLEILPELQGYGTSLQNACSYFIQVESTQVQRAGLLAVYSLSHPKDRCQLQVFEVEDQAKIESQV